jgi:hypothetical protein
MTMPDERPAWMTPMSYADGPAIPLPTTVEDDTPLDYSKGPHKEPFGEDEDEVPDQGDEEA